MAKETYIHAFEIVAYKRANVRVCEREQRRVF